MKKIISMFLSITMLCSTIFLINVSAVDEITTNNSVIEIYADKSSVTEESDLVDSATVSQLNADPQTLQEYENILIEENILGSMDTENMEQLLYNGTNIMVYGSDIDLLNVMDTFGDGQCSIDETTEQEVAAVEVSISEAGNLNYSAICNLYAQQKEEINTKTQESMVVEITNNITGLTPTPEMLCSSIELKKETDDQIKEADIIDNEAMVDDKAYLQIPGGYWAEQLSTIWNSWVDGVRVGETISRVYIYSKGKLKSNTSRRSVDIYTYNVSTAVGGVRWFADYHTTALKLNYNNQSLKEYSHLPSNGTVSYNLGASISSGIGISAGTSYALTVNGHIVNNYPNFTNNKVTWEVIGNVTNVVNFEAAANVEQPANQGHVGGYRRIDICFMKQNPVPWTYSRYIFEVDYEKFGISYNTK